MTPQVNVEMQREEQARSSAEERSLLPSASLWREPTTVTPSQPPEGVSPSSKPPVIGVLLIHGLNGNPSDLAELATFLQEHGMETTTMLLPGHGKHGCEMRPVDWHEWTAAVRTELNRLEERCDRVFLLGHSLGGTLALYVAAQEEVTGVVAICPPLQLDPWLPLVVGLLKYVMPVVPTLHTDVCDPEARRRLGEVYRWAPTQTMESALQFCQHVRAVLPQVTAPALILTSIHDHVVPARDAQEIYHLLGSRTKHLLTFQHSAHVLIMDYDREAVFAQTADFIARQVHETTAQRSGSPVDIH